MAAPGGTPPVRVAVDAMGGDHAPHALVRGALDAALCGLAVPVLVGDPAVLTPVLAAEGAEGLELVAAEGAVGMGEAPLAALRTRKDASIAVAMRLLAEGHVHAVVSAGSTGATLAAATLTLGRLPGVDRPAVAAVLPTRSGPCVLVDVGANVDVRPRDLALFGHLGSIYHEALFGSVRPRVGLLNVGSEPGKGPIPVQEAHARLAAMPEILFLGNVEGRDLPQGVADVVVCDGFVGNGLLKFGEALAEVLLEELRAAVARDWRGRLGGWLLRPALAALRRRLDHREHGGAPLLGVEGVCIVAHGSADARAVRQAIDAARGAVRGELVSRLRVSLAQRAGGLP